jgi:deoxyribose-phosphate aldolase
MNNADILKHVDHTLLKPVSNWADIKKLCCEAIQYKTACVCIPPSYVRRIEKTFGEQLTICTVIGFPLGYQTETVKVAEAVEAVADGAEEVDMVVNLGDVKNGDDHKIMQEIKAVKKAIGNRVLKVIIETCYLSRDEKIRLCRCVTESGADFIKTSTGFGTEGALIDDVMLFKQHIGPHVKIKAAGGIRTREDLVRFIEAGCERIGTSSAVSLLTGGDSSGY